jgi:hypothetical protein
MGAGFDGITGSILPVEVADRLTRGRRGGS